ncbi:MAG TPA: YgeY family selenium metabolism-linked hydrolase [Candidatus Dormibacteraeota bacterium]
MSASLGDEQVLAFLRDLVMINSTPGREERVVHRIVDEMQKLGYQGAHVDAAGNAVGHFGAGSPVVLTDCHIDTIPEHGKGQWHHDPFGAEMADGRLYGLGVSDMKASAAAVIYGVARLYASGRAPHGTVHVVSSVAEEMMEGAALAHTFDECKPDLALIGEPTDLRLAIGQKGRAKLEVDVTGVASHAGHPEVGVNAVEMMAELISRVAAIKHPTHPVLGTRTATCIDILSDPYPSVSMVPPGCRARFDCRFGPDETQESLIAMLLDQSSAWDGARRKPELDVHMYVATFTTFNGRAYRVPEFAPAWLTPRDSPVVHSCLAELREAGLPAIESTYGFCTNGSLTAGLRKVTTLGYGIGKEEVAHTVDEYIDVDKLFSGTNGYSAVVAGMLTAGSARA